MSHFAELDESNTVLRVIVADDENWCVHNLGGRWIQTSYNGRIRKNFAGIGYTYDESRDAFIPPQPYPSWLLNEETCQWYAPVPFPDDGKIYNWDEVSQNWVER